MMTTVYLSGVSREKRIADTQRKRVQVISVLTFMSIIEWSVVCMSYYIEIPFWLIAINVVCVLFNALLIYWLLMVYFDQRKREKEIEKQNRKGGMV